MGKAGRSEGRRRTEFVAHVCVSLSWLGCFRSSLIVRLFSPLYAGLMGLVQYLDQNRTNNP